MTSNQQEAELQRRFWQIASDVRGSVDGWDFKQYVLGALFYRFISENFASYIEGGDEHIKYHKLSDDAIMENYYHLSVSAYVEPEDTREKIDIIELNNGIKTTVTKITQLRSEIDAIAAAIERA